MGLKNKFSFLTLFMLAALLLVGCSGCGAITYIERPRPAYISNSMHVNQMMHSVVALVKPTDTGRFRTFCTAFFIQPRRLATAAHCVATYRSVEVIPGLTVQLREDPQVGATFQYVTYQQRLNSERSLEDPTPSNAVVAAFDVDGDVAILDLSSGSESSDNFFRLNSTSIAIGETTYAIGMPGGLPWILTQGIVSQLQRNENGVLEDINTSTLIYFGNSGGPLINDNGEVIGVASAIAYRQPHLAIFKPARNLVSLLNSLRPMSQRH